MQMKKRMLDDKEKEVHKGVLKDLMKDMEGMMGNDMKTRRMQKVTVMAKDKEGLKEGLDKAEDLMEDMPEKEEAVSESKEDDKSSEEHLRLAMALHQKHLDDPDSATPESQQELMDHMKAAVERK